MNVEPAAAAFDFNTYVGRQVSKTYRVIDAAETVVLHNTFNKWPDWLADDEQVNLCILIPGDFARCVADGGVRRIVVPSPYCKGDFSSPRWLRRMLDPNMAQVFARSVNPRALDGEPFSLSQAGDLAAALRVVCAGTEAPETLVPWICRVQAFSYSLRTRGLSSSSPPMVDVIEMLLFCDGLKNSDHLKSALAKACKIALPLSVYDAVKDFCKSARVPDKGTLSRLRLTMEVASMLHRRVLNFERSHADLRYFRFLTWDSTPQFNRDYQLVQVESVRHDDAAGCLALAFEVARQADAGDKLFKDVEEITKHVGSMAAIRSRLHSHALPCVLIGFGASSLTHRFATLLHATRLEVFNNEDLAAYCKELLCLLSDAGTERLLSKVRPLGTTTT